MRKQKAALLLYKQGFSYRIVGKMLGGISRQRIKQMTDEEEKEIVKIEKFNNDECVNVTDIPGIDIRTLHVLERLKVIRISDLSTINQGSLVNVIDCGELTASRIMKLKEVWGNDDGRR